MIRVYVAIPTRRGELDVAVSTCLNNILENAHNHGIAVTYGMSSSASIDQIRSMYASMALRESDNIDVLFFIDDDVLYTLDEFISVVKNCDKTREVVGGLYPTRMPNAEGRYMLPVRRLEGTNALSFGPGQPLVSVAGLPGGFLTIHVDALRKISSQLEKCNIAELDSDLDSYPFFMPMLHREKIEDLFPSYLCEDLAFCRRAIDNGIGVWLDPTVKARHLSKYAVSFEDVQRTNRA